MEQKLWFGRDYFGRRSLLWHLPSNPDDILAVTSVTERNSAATDTTLVNMLLPWNVVTQKLEPPCTAQYTPPQESTAQ